MSTSAIRTEINESTLTIILHGDFYEKEAIRAASYKFTEKCTVLIRPRGESEVEVLLESIPGLNCDLSLIAGQFCNEVLDQQVRLDLEKRYGKVRELIVRQAFAPVNDLQPVIMNDE
jgi:His-Xaa-Ser system protein HxsD